MNNICSRCGTYLGYAYGMHVCTPYPQPAKIYENPYYIPPSVMGQKCDLCGSTAIDHTEIHCSLNRSVRQLNNTVGHQDKNEPKDKVPK